VLTDHGMVMAVSRDGEHRFSKTVTDEITLLPGLGVQGDAHVGSTVQHRSRVAADPTQPNLRQVHLIHVELHAELRELGFDVAAGQMGENILTAGVEQAASRHSRVTGKHGHDGRLPGAAGALRGRYRAAGLQNHQMVAAVLDRVPLTCSRRSVPVSQRSQLQDTGLQADQMSFARHVGQGRSSRSRTTHRRMVYRAA